MLDMIRFCRHLEKALYPDVSVKLFVEIAERSAVVKRRRVSAKIEETKIVLGGFEGDVLRWKKKLSLLIRCEVDIKDSSSQERSGANDDSLSLFLPGSTGFQNTLTQVNNRQPGCRAGTVPRGNDSAHDSSVRRHQALCRRHTIQQPGKTLIEMLNAGQEVQNSLVNS